MTGLCIASRRRATPISIGLVIGTVMQPTDRSQIASEPIAHGDFTFCLPSVAEATCLQSRWPLRQGVQSHAGGCVHGINRAPEAAQMCAGAREPELKRSLRSPGDMCISSSVCAVSVFIRRTRIRSYLTAQSGSGRKAGPIDSDSRMKLLSGTRNRNDWASNAFFRDIRARTTVRRVIVKKVGAEIWR